MTDTELIFEIKRGAREKSREVLITVGILSASLFALYNVHSRSFTVCKFLKNNNFD